jgi:hypothetical protein
MQLVRYEPVSLLAVTTDTVKTAHAWQPDHLRRPDGSVSEGTTVRPREATARSPRSAFPEQAVACGLGRGAVGYM